MLKLVISLAILTHSYAALKYVLVLYDDYLLPKENKVMYFLFIFNYKF